MSGSLRPQAGIQFALALLATLGLLACTDVPELDATVPAHLEKADYPPLVSLPSDQFSTAPPEDEAEKLRNNLEGRRNALERRSRDLSEPVIDPETRARMKEGVEG